MMVSRRGLNATAGKLLVLSIVLPSFYGFAPHISHPHRPPSGTATSATASSTVVDDTEAETNDAIARSPLRFLGPYPTMPLRFPRLATSSQRERNVTGVSLDFVLDTAANVNTINAQVARELSLPVVGEVPAGFGAAGGIAGGDTYMLGDCELDVKVPDISDNEGKETAENESLFMQQLTASALPVASPAAAGLLGLAFFYCFEGGVEFDWGSDSKEGPSVTFYGSTEELNLDGMERVPFKSLEGSMLPSVTLNINGKEIPALFDTGSPITVLNAAAAVEAGVETAISIDDLAPKDEGKGGWNPLSGLAKSFRSAQEIAKATADGDVLAIAGADGQPVRLLRSKSAEDVKIETTSEKEPSSTIGTGQMYVGDLPGLAALGGLGGEAPPAAVLGMDFLSKRSKLVFRARQNEIYL